MTGSVWTIGHGLIPVEDLVALLKKFQVDAVADVRTSPRSERAPQFNERTLNTVLNAAGIDYVAMGDQLGGRPADLRFYDSEGYVLYRALSESPPFVAGIERLITGAEGHRIVVLCSESSFQRCHRNLLVGRALRRRGMAVTHILHDGSTRSFDDYLVTEVGLSGLEEDPWRSLVQVRPELAQRTSSLA